MIASQRAISLTTSSATFYSILQGYDQKRNTGGLTPLARTMVSNRSDSARKKLLNVLRYMVDTAKYRSVWVARWNSYYRYKLVFITLTLSSVQVHSDSYILKNMLQPFLDSYRKRDNELKYVWKAEVQENGNIHFHLITNSYYDYLKIRGYWNHIQRKHNYIKENDNTEYNSTDVKAVSAKGDIAMYLASYFFKKDRYSKVLARWHKRYGSVLKELQDDSFTLPTNYFKHIKRVLYIKFWGCSRELLNYKRTVVEGTSDYITIMSNLSKQTTERYDSDYFTHLRILKDTNVYKHYLFDFLKLPS